MSVGNAPEGLVVTGGDAPPGMCCNLCGSTEFRQVRHRVHGLCARCGSYERTRLMRFYLDRFGIRRETRILHLAPEGGLHRWLRPQVDDYVCADLDLARYSHIPGIQPVDLTDPASYERWGTFDLILHSHVLEHIPTNYSALLLRLHRLLRPGGRHGFSVPIYGPCHSEHWGPLTAEEATERFGQFDHLRRFSAPDLDRSIGALFDLPPAPDLAAEFGAEALRLAAIPEPWWRGWTGSSIFWLAPGDCRFQPPPRPAERKG